MGYETNLIIGRVMDCDNYFLKMVEVDLCKCGYSGAMSDLIDLATHKDNPKEFKEVYFSKSFKIRKDEVIKTLEKEEVEIHIDLLNKVIEVCEGWEHETREDCYGTKLRAVPIEMVIKAMSIENKKEKYRRYSMALPLLRQTKKNFKGTKIYCILFGH